MDNLWLPSGNHWGLHIDHGSMNSAGAFTSGGHKLVWHTTEGSSLDGALTALRDKDAAPHVIIEIATGKTVQVIPFDEAARALQHTLPEETNRARAWQVEIVGFTDPPEGDTRHPLYLPNWTAQHYHRLAALACLTEHRTLTPRQSRHPFDHPTRLSGHGFVWAGGHLGHCHVPGNTHTDPTGLQIHRMFKDMHLVEKKYQ